MSVPASFAVVTLVETGVLAVVASDSPYHDNHILITPYLLGELPYLVNQSWQSKLGNRRTRIGRMAVYAELNELVSVLLQ